MASLFDLGDVESSKGGMTETSVVQNSQASQPSVVRVPVVPCAKEDHGAATVFCKDCCKFCCESCAAKHGFFKSMSEHSMRPVDRDDTERIKPEVAETSEVHHCPAAATEVRQTSVVPAITCSKKYHGAATVFCRDCNKFYCDSCSAKHEFFEDISGHRIRPVDKMSHDDIEFFKSASKGKTCADHEQPLNMICKTCNKLICTTCETSKHKNHHLQELVEVVKEAQNQMEHIVLETRDQINRKNETMPDIRETRKTIRANITTAAEAVKEAAHKMCEIIKTHEKDLLRDLQRHKTKALTDLDATRGEPQVYQSLPNDEQEQTDKAGQSESVLDHVVQRPVKQDCLDTEHKLKQQNMTWKFTLETKKRTEDSLKAMLGNVKLTPAVTLGDAVQQVPLKYDGGYLVTGMVVIGDFLCITHGGDPHLWLYDMTRDRVQICQVKGLEDPRGMVLLKSADRTVVITDANKNSCKLHYVKISTDFSITRVKECTLPVKCPLMISVSRETGELLICNGRVGRSSQFVVCNLEGVVQRQVTVASPEGTDCHSRCATRAKDGYAVVMIDEDRNSIIQWLDKDGKCTRTYGIDEQLKGAHHMSIDSEGRLIVAEYSNDRVHLVDFSGYLSQLLLTQDDGTVGPSCVYLDEAAERLYVAHGYTGSNEVRVYRWHPKPRDTYQLEVNISQF